MFVIQLQNKEQSTPVVNIFVVNNFLKIRANNMIK